MTENHEWKNTLIWVESIIGERVEEFKEKFSNEIDVLQGWNFSTEMCAFIGKEDGYEYSYFRGFVGEEFNPSKEIGNMKVATKADMEEFWVKLKEGKEKRKKERRERKEREGVQEEKERT